jgi:hypothetical protein
MKDNKPTRSQSSRMLLSVLIPCKAELLLVLDGTCPTRSQSATAGIKDSVEVVAGTSGSPKVVLTHGGGSSAEVRAPVGYNWWYLVQCQALSLPDADAQSTLHG